MPRPLKPLLTCQDLDKLLGGKCTTRPGGLAYLRMRRGALPAPIDVHRPGKKKGPRWCADTFALWHATERQAPYLWTVQDIADAVAKRIGMRDQGERKRFRARIAEGVAYNDLPRPLFLGEDTQGNAWARRWLPEDAQFYVDWRVAEWKRKKAERKRKNERKRLKGEGKEVRRATTKGRQQDAPWCPGWDAWGPLVLTQREADRTMRLGRAARNGEVPVFSLTNAGARRREGERRGADLARRRLQCEQVDALAPPQMTKQTRKATPPESANREQAKRLAARADTHTYYLSRTLGDELGVRLPTGRRPAWEWAQSLWVHAEDAAGMLRLAVDTVSGVPTFPRPVLEGEAASPPETRGPGDRGPTRFWRRRELEQWVASRERHFADIQAKGADGGFMQPVDVAKALQITENLLDWLSDSSRPHPLPRDPERGCRADLVMAWVWAERERQRERDGLLKHVAVVTLYEAAFLLRVGHAEIARYNRLGKLVGIKLWSPEMKTGKRGAQVVHQRVRLRSVSAARDPKREIPPVPDEQISFMELVVALGSPKVARWLRKHGVKWWAQEQDRFELAWEVKDKPAGAERYTQHVVKHEDPEGERQPCKGEWNRDASAAAAVEQQKGLWPQRVAWLLSQGVPPAPVVHEDKSVWYRLLDVDAWLTALEDRERELRGIKEPTPRPREEGQPAPGEDDDACVAADAFAKKYADAKWLSIRAFWVRHQRSALKGLTLSVVDAHPERYEIDKALARGGGVKGDPRCWPEPYLVERLITDRAG